MKLFKQMKKYGAQVVAVGSGLALSTGVALAQSTNPLLAAATTETGAAKTNLLEVAGMLFIVTLALWGAYKIIGMFGKR